MNRRGFIGTMLGALAVAATASMPRWLAGPRKVTGKTFRNKTITLYAGDHYDRCKFDHCHLITDPDAAPGSRMEVSNSVFRFSENVAIYHHSVAPGIATACVTTYGNQITICLNNCAWYCVPTYPYRDFFDSETLTFKNTGSRTAAIPWACATSTRRPRHA